MSSSSDHKQQSIKTDYIANIWVDS